VVEPSEIAFSESTVDELMIKTENENAKRDFSRKKEIERNRPRRALPA